MLSLNLQVKPAARKSRALAVPGPLVVRTRLIRKGTTMFAACAAAVTVKPTREIRQKLETAEAFCFDVDSTFCEDESIDELAAYLGVGEQVAALTAKAMGGSVEFKDALTARLGVMRPQKTDIEKFLSNHPHKISKGIPELVNLLKKRGQKVFLVSGGFRQIIHPLADLLDIPRSQVFANDILFDANGQYAGFNEKEFTCRSGGKPAAIRHIKEQYGLQRVVMVGDGATDLEAKLEGAADLVVGYGGVVVRQKVADQADWFVMRIEDITEQLSA